MCALRSEVSVLGARNGAEVLPTQVQRIAVEQMKDGSHGLPMAGSITHDRLSTLSPLVAVPVSQVRKANAPRATSPTSSATGPNCQEPRIEIRPRSQFLRHCEH